MVKIIVKTSDERKYEITLDHNSTLLDFGQKIEQDTSIPVTEQRLISLGKFLRTEDDFNNLKSQKTPNVLVSRRPSMKLTIPQIPVKRNNVKSEVRKRYETAWVLLNNCQSCIEAFRQNISPDTRRRIDNPEGMVLSRGENPCASDFGILTAKTAAVYSEMSKMFSESGSELAQIENNPEKIVTKQHKIQLAMDSARYMAALNQLISGFIIPLRHSSPRFLSFKQNPTARR